MSIKQAVSMQQQQQQQQQGFDGQEGPQHTLSSLKPCHSNIMPAQQVDKAGSSLLAVQ